MGVSRTTSPPRRSPVSGKVRGGGPVRRSARLVGGVFTGSLQRLRRASHAKGAGESGLAKLIELHLVNNAGDALVTLALATTVFFSVPTGEARDRVALYLLITMAPFALMAPVIGPLLDRLRRGRRWAMATTMLVRAWLAWVMAGSVEDAGLELYPAAFGVLVASKAYGVSRSAVVPRLQPRSASLVKVNSRITMFGLLGTLAAAPLAGGLKATMGTAWILYAAVVVFVGGAVLSLLLPAKVDSAQGEERAAFSSDAPGTERRPVSLVRLVHPDRKEVPPQRPDPKTDADAGVSGPDANGTGARDSDVRDTDARGAAPKPTDANGTGPNGSGPPGSAPPGSGPPGPGARPPGKRPRSAHRLRSVGPTVMLALWANAAMRAFSGFLIMFLGFMLREHPIGGMEPNVALAAVAGAAAVGNGIGTMLGAWLKARGPEVIVAGVLAVSAASAVTAATLYAVSTVVAVAAVAGLAQALGKLSLDAMIQRDIPEEVRTSAFARTETALQLAWVAGGVVGISLPLHGTLGMSVAAATLLLALAFPGRRLATRRSRRRRSPGIRVRAAR